MKLKSISFLAVAASITLASCLKSRDSLGILNDNGSIVTEIADVNTEGSIKVVSLNATPANETVGLLTLRTHAARSAQPNGSVRVRLTQVPALAQAYDQFPSGSISFPAEIEVPANTKEIQIPFTINKSGLDLTKNYGIGLRIAEVNQGVISELAKEIVVNVLIKNQYDGVYTLKGQFYHPTPANQGNFTFTMEMHTSGPNSVKMYWPLLQGYAHPWTSGGAPTYFGAQEPNYTIDPTTRAVTVQNAYVGATTFYTMAPGYSSRYDPATKTIYAKWGYNYSAGPTFNPATNREWTDTLIYVGPR